MKCLLRRRYSGQHVFTGPLNLRLRWKLTHGRLRKPAPTAPEGSSNQTHRPLCRRKHLVDVFSRHLMHRGLKHLKLADRGMRLRLRSHFALQATYPIPAPQNRRSQDANLLTSRHLHLDTVNSCKPPHDLLHDVALHIAVKQPLFRLFGQDHGLIEADVALLQNFGIGNQLAALRGA